MTARTLPVILGVLIAILILVFGPRELIAIGAILVTIVTVGFVLLP